MYRRFVADRWITLWKSKTRFILVFRAREHRHHQRQQSTIEEVSEIEGERGVEFCQIKCQWFFVRTGEQKNILDVDLVLKWLSNLTNDKFVKFHCFAIILSEQHRMMSSFEKQFWFYVINFANVGNHWNKCVCFFLLYKCYFSTFIW